MNMLFNTKVGSSVIIKEKQLNLDEIITTSDDGPFYYLSNSRGDKYVYNGSEDRLTMFWSIFDNLWDGD